MGELLFYMAYYQFALNLARMHEKSKFLQQTNKNLLDFAFAAGQSLESKMLRMSGAYNVR